MVWEILRRKRVGYEKMCCRRVVRASWERSKLTKEVRSAKPSGSDVR